MKLGGKIFSALVALTFGLAASRLLAQTPGEDGAPPVDRSYKLLREDEDWTLLCDPALKQDFWDSIKYIRLRPNDDEWYLTVGGEAREVWEQIGNDYWGQFPYMNGYLLERYMLSFDVPSQRKASPLYGNLNNRDSMGTEAVGAKSPERLNSPSGSRSCYA